MTITIKELRAMTGMTQKAFAETYGIPKRTVEDWEGGRMTPPIYVHDLLENAILEDLAGSRIRYRVERIEKDGNTPYDSFEGMFRTSRAANEHAENIWDRIDKMDKKTCKVYVYYVREKDFDPGIGFDKDDENEMWEGCDVQWTRPDLFDSEMIDNE